MGGADIAELFLQGRIVIAPSPQYKDSPRLGCWVCVCVGGECKAEQDLFLYH